MDLNTIKSQLEKYLNQTENYFKHLDTKEIIAWSVIGLGIILLIVGLIL